MRDQTRSILSRPCIQAQSCFPVQLACRVSSTSVTATGCSITSTATISTAGATGCFKRRAAFFTGARLGLALAGVRFDAFPRAALDTLRALPGLAEFALRSFPRLSTFDPFLRLAMIAPLVLANDTPSKSRQASKRELSTDRPVRRILPRSAIGFPPPRRYRFLIANLENSIMARGTVKWSNSQKGYDFILPTGGGMDVFVHISAVERAGLSSLNEGQQIEFEIEDNRGKSSAVNLRAR
jgi:CspA family cold shock protein